MQNNSHETFQPSWLSGLGKWNRKSSSNCSRKRDRLPVPLSPARLIVRYILSCGGSCSQINLQIAQLCARVIACYALQLTIQCTTRNGTPFSENGFNIFAGKLRSCGALRRVQVSIFIQGTATKTDKSERKKAFLYVGFPIAVSSKDSLHSFAPVQSTLNVFTKERRKK